MNVDEYRQKVVELFKSGNATEQQWDEVSHAVLHASEENSDEATAAIDAHVFAEEMKDGEGVHTDTGS